MTTLRGRAASPVRPGFVIKSILMGETPLVTGEFVTEAAITDLHSAYKELIKRENTLRPKAKRLRGMTAQSFKTLYKFAQLLHLVELVREEPMQFPPPGGPLYSVRKPDGVHVVVSTRRIFKITDIGREDERSWTNLCRAWIEQWPAPAKVEYVPPKPPPIVKPPPVKPPPVEVLPEVTPIKWVPRPSDKQFGILLEHLEELRRIGIENTAVKIEVNRLAMLIGDWVMEIEDMLEDAKSIAFAEAVGKYTEMLRLVNELSEALGDQDIDRAIINLEELAK